MVPAVDECPCRCPATRQADDLSPRQAVAREPHGREPTPRPQRIGGAIDDRNGRQMKDFLPAMPARHLLKVVGAHQPDPAGAGKPTLQGAQRVQRVAGSELALQIADHQPRVARRRPGLRQTLAQRRQVAGRLQRIGRRDKPDDEVQPQAAQGDEADVAVPFVRRVERSAQHTDPQPLPQTAGADPQDAVQGRTCPVPRTLYL